MWSKVSPSAPVITSASSFTIQENLFGSLPLTAIGIPTPTLSVQGALPSGVSFDGHNLQGRPATGTAGTYPLIVTASNGITPDATQNFSLKITPGYAFLNSSTTTFQVGVANSFTTFTDAPNPDGNNFTHGPGSGNAYGAPNYLPAGLSYNSSGVLSGTAPAFSGGVIPLVFFRGNVPGQQQGLVQNFNLVIVEAPSIAGPSTQNFTVGKASSFSAAATSGYPAPSVTIGGTLPAGVTYNAVSGMVSGTALSGTGGTYPLSFEAVNGVQPNFFKSVSLVVSVAPIIQTANNTTFTSGINNSFTATASGYPAPNLQLSGTLPAGVSVTSNTGANNISTLVLSGNPASSVGGIYKFSLVASGTTPPNAAQNFTLTVNSPPTFTGVINPTFVVGASGAFSVTATGYPVPTFSVAGALPSGLSFNSATGAITGIPAAGATGSYPITITAGNGILPNATQNSTLVVKQPAGITSASSATFTVGSSSVFHITTTDPAATVSYTGTLPVGVIFFNGILGGTPVSGSAGVYPITFQASLATGSVVTQSFVLTVAKIMPAITWNPPAPMSFGGGLGSAQLNATAAIQGTYLYTPPAGTVLPPGDGQLLSVVFKPANMTDYVATTVTTTVSISPIPPTAQPVNLVSTPVLSRDANFNLVVTLTVANAGISTAQNVTITSLNVGTSIAPGFPVNLGAMPSGAIVTYTTTLPASSVGAAGTGSSLTLAGIYSGGTFNCAVRLVFP
jgi:hypothetical protein